MASQGMGAPICSSTYVDPLGHSWACAANVGEQASLLMVLSFILLIFVFGWLYRKVTKAEETDLEELWFKRLENIQKIVQHAAVSFYQTLGTSLAITTLFWAFVLLAAASGAARHDYSDGIRVGADFILGAVAALSLGFFTAFVSQNSARGIARAAFSHPDEGGMRTGMKSAVQTGALGAIVATVGAVLSFAIMYQLTALNRNNASSTFRGFSCGTGNLCATAFGAESIAGFAAGFSLVTLAVRLFAGMLYKCAEIADGLVAALIPWSRDSDLMGNPAFITASLGATLTEVSGLTLELTDSLICAMAGGLAIASGDSAQATYVFWLTGWMLALAVISVFWILPGHPHVDDTEEYKQRDIAWAYRKGAILNFGLFFVTGLLGTPLVFSRWDNDVGPDAPGGLREGWRLYACGVLGHLSALIMQEMAGFFSSGLTAESVASSGQTGSATMLIQAFGVGLCSSFPAAMVVALLVATCGAISGQFGIAVAAISFLAPGLLMASCSAITPSAFLADVIASGTNEDGPEGMVGGDEARESTAPLCIGGERLGGIVRAYSVTAATLASLAAIAGLREVTGLTRLSAVGVMDVGSVGAWNSLAAASFGAFVPFFLGGLTILSIGPATRILVDEIRQQLSQNVLAGRHSLAELQSVFYPDRLATAPFLGTRKGMWLQLSACVLFPACVGFAAGPRALVAFCTGATVTSAFLALSGSVIGTLTARAKTVIEVEEMFGGSGSETHAATVTGSLFAGPLRDCFAPVVMAGTRHMCTAALVIAPLVQGDATAWFAECVAANLLNGESVNICWDWGRAYWVIIPGVITLALGGASFWFFWRGALRAHLDDPAPHPLPPIGGLGTGVPMVPAPQPGKPGDEPAASVAALTSVASFKAPAPAPAQAPALVPAPSFTPKAAPPPKPHQAAPPIVSPNSLPRPAVASPKMQSYYVTSPPAAAPPMNMAVASPSFQSIASPQHYQAQAQGSLVSYPVSSALGYPGTSTSPAQVRSPTVTGTLGTVESTVHAERFESQGYREMAPRDAVSPGRGRPDATARAVESADTFVASGYAVDDRPRTPGSVMDGVQVYAVVPRGEPRGRTPV